MQGVQKFQFRSFKNVKKWNSFYLNNFLILLDLSSSFSDWTFFNMLLFIINEGFVFELLTWKVVIPTETVKSASSSLICQLSIDISVAFDSSSRTAAWFRCLGVFLTYTLITFSLILHFKNVTRAKKKEILTHLLLKFWFKKIETDKNEATLVINLNLLPRMLLTSSVPAFIS